MYIFLFLRFNKIIIIIKLLLFIIIIIIVVIVIINVATNGAPTKRSASAHYFDTRSRRARRTRLTV